MMAVGSLHRVQPIGFGYVKGLALQIQLLTHPPEQLAPKLSDRQLSAMILGGCYRPPAAAYRFGRGAIEGAASLKYLPDGDACNPA